MDDQIEKNWNKYKRGLEAMGGEIDYSSLVRKRKEFWWLVDKQKNYLTYARRAAELGCEPASKFVEKKETVIKELEDSWNRYGRCTY